LRQPPPSPCGYASSVMTMVEPEKFRASRVVARFGTAIARMGRSARPRRAAVELSVSVIGGARHACDQVLLPAYDVCNSGVRRFLVVFGTCRAKHRFPGGSPESMADSILAQDGEEALSCDHRNGDRRHDCRAALSWQSRGSKSTRSIVRASTIGKRVILRLRFAEFPRRAR
jgi:hypothetical protein